MRCVAMIPARLGSKRVPRKNLRYLGDKPLLAWVIGAALRCPWLFDEVVVNTESGEIADLAERCGATVYRRPTHLAADGATSEYFVRDFMEHWPCDVLFQVTPTSPFLEPSDFRRAAELVEAGAQTVLSVRRIQAECLLNGRGVNFDLAKPMPPSQDLPPVYAMCNGIFAWDVERFKALQDERGCATYGEQGAVSLLELSGDAAIDIDGEADWQDAEQIVAARRMGRVVTRYWTPEAHSESDAAEVLEHDGVDDGIDMRAFVGNRVNVEDVLRAMPDRGAARVVQTPTGAATLISQQPGEGNRLHYHTDLDEWWLIVEGEYLYEIGEETRFAKKGDIVVIPRGMPHRIQAIGDSRATRLAVSRDGVEHVYAPMAFAVAHV